MYMYIHTHFGSSLHCCWCAYPLLALPMDPALVTRTLWRWITEEMITHPGYPWTIQLPHALAATGSFRRSFSEAEWAELPIWHKLVGAYFCHGYGASIVRDALVGVAPSLITHPTLPRFYLIGWFLSYFSPNDIVYRLTQQSRHPVRLLMIFGEAVDATTTTLGAFEKTAKLHPGGSSLGPYACAFLVAMGGSMWRYFERKGRGWSVKAEWTQPTGTVQKGLAYIIAYGVLRRRFGMQFARLWVTLATVVVALWAEISGQADFNPFGRLVDDVVGHVSRLATVLQLGPPSPRKMHS